MARPGKLDQRVTFQRYSVTSDGAGGSIKTWANVPSTPAVWAQVYTASGRERFDDDRVEAVSTTTFIVRNRNDIDETMRVVWRGEFYNIRQVHRHGAREMYLKISAERGAPIFASGS